MTDNIQKANQTMEKLYLERNETGDVTFLVDSQRICAHRMILAALSPKYKAQFYGPNPDVGEIRVPNISADAFNVFLKFFYKETIDLTVDNIETVLDLAKQSLVDEFIESCVNFLKNQTKSNKNLCTAYRLANLYDNESLRLDCEQRFSTNTKEVFDSADFLQCDRDMLLQILKIDTLNCSEKDVFEASIAWARVQCKKNGLDDGKAENLRAALGDAIYQIRFSSFTAEQFADLHKPLEGLFKPDEVFELLYITTKLKDFKPQKFNGSARTTQKNRNESLNMLGEVNAILSRETDRFAGMHMPPVGNVTIGLVEFSCDDEIRLQGIVLAIPYSEIALKSWPETLSVSFGDRSHYDQSVNLKFNTYPNSTQYDETTIMFDEPIDWVRFFSCDFPLSLKRLGYEPNLEPTVYENGVQFTFNSKWISRVICVKAGSWWPEFRY